jgi:hypothetical protein
VAEEDQAQKDVEEVVVVVVHVDSTPLAEEAGVVPFVDDAEMAAAEAVHNIHTEQEAEHTSFQDNHI